jgi:TetR/AcrR family transcriptional regulator, cholesterol catabolism regulator
MTTVGTRTTKRAAEPPAVDSLDEVQLERRARIVDAAIEMMLETEYERIQMKDVTAAAGVALGTTYRYFASKEHLLAQALLAWSERFPPLDEPTSSGRSVDHLKKAYRRAVRAFEPHPTAYGAMVVLQATTDPWAVPLFNEFAARQTESFARYLPRIASPRREQLVTVMSAVLDVHLRAWCLGQQTIRQVYATLDTTAELLLGNG